MIRPIDFVRVTDLMKRCARCLVDMLSKARNRFTWDSRKRTWFAPMARHFGGVFVDLPAMRVRLGDVTILFRRVRCETRFVPHFSRCSN